MDAALIIDGTVTLVWRDAPMLPDENGVPTNICALPDPPQGEIVLFPAGQVVAGQAWDGAALTEPAVVPTVADLTRYAADKGWRVETAGIVVDGLPVPTDDRAKLLLLGATSSMADSDTAEFVSGGASVALTGAQFRALYAAITAHVQATFAARAAVLEAIADGRVTTYAAVDAWAWPENK